MSSIRCLVRVLPNLYSVSRTTCQQPRVLHGLQSPSRWLVTSSLLRLPESSQSKPESQDEDETAKTEEEKPKEGLRPVIDVETSIKYMQSKAYQMTYRGEPVWVPYRRNHKGGRPPEQTRKSCIRFGKVTTGNPCPICRDEYLVLHETNLELLKQFLSAHTGEVLSYQKTGVCQSQHKALIRAVSKAWDLGYIEMPLPFRKYDYSQYYPQLGRSATEQAGSS